MPSIEENLKSVRERIAAACRRSGRQESDVALVAVTKTVGPGEVAELYRLGVRDFGENRVGDGLAHKEALNRPDARWHLIGHLQRNKAAEALAGGYALIHSVESEKLLEVLEKEMEKRPPQLDRRVAPKARILFEVNVSGEDSKYGLPPDAGVLSALAEKAAALRKVQLYGLMTMAPLTEDPEASRPHFRRLAELKREVSRRIGRELPDLSMGMTGDFEVAVEEGATLVRIGTALFR